MYRINNYENNAIKHSHGTIKDLFFKFISFSLILALNNFGLFFFFLTRVCHYTFLFSTLSLYCHLIIEMFVSFRFPFHFYFVFAFVLFHNYSVKILLHNIFFLDEGVCAPSLQVGHIHRFSL